MLLRPKEELDELRQWVTQDPRRYRLNRRLEGTYGVEPLRGIYLRRGIFRIYFHFNSGRKNNRKWKNRDKDRLYNDRNNYYLFEIDSRQFANEDETLSAVLDIYERGMSLHAFYVTLNEENKEEGERKIPLTVFSDTVRKELQGLYLYLIERSIKNRNQNNKQ